MPKRRKKQSLPPEEPPAPVADKPLVDKEVIEWVHEHVESAIKMFDEKHWTKELEEEVIRLCLGEELCSKLFIWINGESVAWSREVPKEIIGDTALVFNFSNGPVSMVDMEQKIMVREVKKNHLKSLVLFMNRVLRMYWRGSAVLRNSALSLIAPMPTFCLK